jgi:hypothetical protein
MKDMLEPSNLQLAYYKEIKRILLETYGYADLESVFNVVEQVSLDSRYADLGFISAYILHKKGIDVKLRMSVSTEVELAKKLSIAIKEFVRHICQLEESLTVEGKIEQLYGDLFDAVCSKYNIGKISGGGKQSYSYPNCPIYTTNYDLVQEKYWQGLAHINDLWKEDGNIMVLDVEKREGDIVELVKLHGSLNWFKLEDGTIVKMDSSQERFARRRVEGELVLYPIRQKNMYLYPWFDLFGRFKDDLERTINWIVIGYSFNDEFIRNSFLEVLRVPGHKLIIVGPNASKITSTFFNNQESVIPIDGKFGDNDTVPKIISNL